MRTKESTGTPSRRETGALILMALLALSAVMQIMWMCLYGISTHTLVPLTATLLALATSPWWSGRPAPACPDSGDPAPDGVRRWTWIAAGAAVVLAVWPRSTQLNQGLSDHEIAEVESGNWGRWEAQPDGKRTFDAVTWNEAVDLTNWFHESPFIRDWRSSSWGRMEARAGHWLFGGTWEETKSFKEYACRVFPWISGLVTVGVLALLGAMMSSPRAGLAAGLILAVHPMHIRWSTEMGSTSTMLLSIVAALLFLMQALRTNRWRWWLALAVAEAVCKFCVKDAFGILTGINAAGVLVILGSRSSRRDRLSNVLRMIAVFVFSTSWPVLKSQSSLLQLSDDLGLNYSMSAVETWSRAVCGLDALGLHGDRGEEFVTPAQLAVNSGWRGVSVWYVIPLLAAGGLLYLVIQNWRARLVAVSLGCDIVFLEDRTSLMLVVLLLPLALAWAGEGLTKMLPGQKRLQHAPLFIGMVFAMTILPALQRVAALPRVPLRDVAAAAREQGGPQVMTASLEGEAVIYDSGVRVIESMQDLDAAAAAAYEQERTLMIYCRRGEIHLSDGARLREELEKSGRFQLLEEFTAVEADDYYRLYRYHPREKIIHLNLKPEK